MGTTIRRAMPPRGRQVSNRICCCSCTRRRRRPEPVRRRGEREPTAAADRHGRCRRRSRGRCCSDEPDVLGLQVRRCGQGRGRHPDAPLLVPGCAPADRHLGGGRLRRHGPRRGVHRDGDPSRIPGRRDTRRQRKLRLPDHRDLARRLVDDPRFRPRHEDVVHLPREPEHAVGHHLVRRGDLRRRGPRTVERGPDVGGRQPPRDRHDVPRVRLLPGPEDRRRLPRHAQPQ